MRCKNSINKIAFCFRHAHDEYLIVANSFRYSQIYSNKLFFAMVDFDEGSEVFQMVSLFGSDIYSLYNNCYYYKHNCSLGIITLESGIQQLSV